MNHLKVFFSAIAFTVVSACFSQNAKIDSLDRLLMNPQLADSARVVLLHEKCRIFITNDPEKALLLIKEADSLLDITGFETEKAINQMLMGGYYSGVGQYQRALTHFKTSLDLFVLLKDSVGTASSYLNIGTIYASMGRYSKAVDMLLKSLEISERNGDRNKVSSALMNIGSIYYQQKNYDKAFRYKSKALEIADDLDNKPMILLLLNNIGLLLIDMSDEQSALKYFNKGLALAKSLGNKRLEATLLSNIGGIKVQLEQYSEAIKVLNKSLLLARQYNFKSLIAHSNMVFCQLYFQTRDYDKSIKSGKKSLLIAQSTNDKEIIKEASYYLSKAYSAIKNYEKAYFHLNECKTQTDSLLNKENIEKITSLEETYKFEKEKREIEFQQSKKDALSLAEKKRQQALLYTFIIGFLLMMSAVIVMLRMYFQKRKKNHLLWSQKNEIELLNVELKKSLDTLKSTQSMLVQSEKMASLAVLTAGVAHEINNPLNYIMGGYSGLKEYFHDQIVNPKNEDLIILFDLIKNGLTAATDIVNRLGLLSGGKGQLSERCELHKIIDNCLSISKSKIAHGTTITKHYNAQSAIITGNTSNLHQVILNLLYNAYQALKNNGGTITINTYDASSDKLGIEIIDDGCGIPKENLAKVIDPFFTTREPGEGKGLGLSITYSLVEEHGGELTIASEPDKGTKVQVILPIERLK